MTWVLLSWWDRANWYANKNAGHVRVKEAFMNLEEEQRWKDWKLNVLEDVCTRSVSGKPNHAGRKQEPCLPHLLWHLLSLPNVGIMSVGTKFNRIPFLLITFLHGNPNCFKPIAVEKTHTKLKWHSDDLSCACARLHSPVQLRAQMAALQSLHTPSYSSCALSWIR